jgi:YgiT-type zinc finger domain-containing protein
MVNRKCSVCGGRLMRNKKPFVIEANGQRLLIENVPCFECNKCGLTTVDSQVVRTIKGIGRLFKEGQLKTEEVVIPKVDFSSARPRQIK